VPEGAEERPMGAKLGPYVPRGGWRGPECLYHLAPVNMKQWNLAAARRETD